MSKRVDQSSFKLLFSSHAKNKTCKNIGIEMYLTIYTGKNYVVFMYQTVLDQDSCFRDTRKQEVVDLRQDNIHEISPSYGVAPRI